MENGIWPIGHPFNEMSVEQRRACIQAAKAPPQKPIPPDIDRYCTGCGKVTNKGERCVCRLNLAVFLLFMLAAHIVAWTVFFLDKVFSR